VDPRRSERYDPDRRMARPALALSLAAFAAVTVSAFRQQIESVPDVYQELAGDYEYYVPKAYVVTRLWVEDRTLWSQDEGSAVRDRLLPVELRALRFKVDRPGEEQLVEFRRDAHGQITSFRVTVGQGPNASIIDGTKIRRRAPPFGDRIGVAGLTEDLLKVREALERLHPALYAFTDRRTIERLFDEQRRRLDRPLTATEFYRRIAPVVAAVGCAHTRLLLPAAFWTEAPPQRFPLRVTFLSGRAYVTGSYDRTLVVPAGSELLTVNGRRVSDVTRDLALTISADGRRLPFKWTVLGGQVDRYLAVEFGFPLSWVVTYALPSGTGVRKATLPAVGAEIIEAHRAGPGAPIQSGDPNLAFEVLGDPAVAVLTVRSFDYYDADAVGRFQRFIDDAFAKIASRAIPRLVLDLRGNGGGSPMATTHLLSYVEPRPVPYFAREYGGGYEVYAKDIPRATGAFAGNLVTLIDGGVLSSTGHLCALLKFHKIGTLVGTETGGTFECHDASYLVNLWNSGLRLTVARMTFTAAVQGMRSDRGVVPDDVVEPRGEDIALGRDVAKDFAFGLLSKAPR
jgi:hypothetical protein